MRLRTVGGGVTAPEPSIDGIPAIRDLRPDEAPVSAAIHGEVLDMEFLSRFGPGFLTAYHRAWIRSPAGLALAATGPGGTVTGVMLGSLDPAAHYDWLLRKAGPGLAARMAGYALFHPVLARELLATRATRYGRAIAIRVAARARRALGAGRKPTEGPTAAPGGEAPAGRAGEITHLMVASAGRGGGYGRALVEETERRAAAAGVRELVLVTPPELDARRFYEHLGWETIGGMTSRSGEEFIRFRRSLRSRPADPTDPS